MGADDFRAENYGHFEKKIEEVKFYETVRGKEALELAKAFTGEELTQDKELQDNIFNKYNGGSAYKKSKPHTNISDYTYDPLRSISTENWENVKPKLSDKEWAKVPVVFGTEGEKEVSRKPLIQQLAENQEKINHLYDEIYSTLHKLRNMDNNPTLNENDKEFHAYKMPENLDARNMSQEEFATKKTEQHNDKPEESEAYIKATKDFYDFMKKLVDDLANGIELDDATKQKMASFGKSEQDLEKKDSPYNNSKEGREFLPEGFGIYECTDCQEINIKKNNGEIAVGFCSKCEHPLWNSVEDVSDKINTNKHTEVVNADPEGRIHTEMTTSNGGFTFRTDANTNYINELQATGKLDEYVKALVIEFLKSLPLKAFDSFIDFNSKKVNHRTNIFISLKR